MKRVTAVIAALVLLLGVAGVVVMVNQRAISVAQAPQVTQAPEPLLLSASSPPSPEFRAKVTEVMDALADDDAMGDVHGMVADVATGEVLWSRNADKPVTPASTTKLLTATAVLLGLPGDDRVPTKVLSSPQDGTVILSGAWDPTLSRSGSGAYPGAASIADLAAQVRKQAGAVDTVIVDTAPNKDSWRDDWDRSGIKAGYIAPIESVEIDAGQLGSGRSDSPAMDAAAALADELGANNVEATDNAAGVDLLGEVRSAPLTTRVHQMLQHSDNVLAESLGRELAVSRGKPATFAGAAEAVKEVLAEHDLLVPDGLSGADTSGLSPANKVTPQQLTQVLRAATTNAELAAVLDGIPVAGVNGTLSTRYTGSSGRGWIRAKTGTLSPVSSLSGVLTNSEGRVLTFTLISDDVDIAAARAAADRGVSELQAITDSP
ncbi:D-alanyl-D-alanine carboxypeptidase/D-alanyl-D-alanine-endopeptidase [Corynebacterium sp. TAE3-ERU12]|uniref:D-alanyl-D-alanine carboxypeptidase/D-alanyl-D-alanine endopeptidase n=1 Tax=Corynebacterium sp. TAE3-ERU12 TaxID=2849491 RepID=UPI001C484C1D|nr:D-alanyl-D-alanine carboxypeptidase/D-alanyl-D-alanine-endopeptidase [Corynebacterium sp. TAE3-ERU12]MBV7295936.1 D-alanyl-D-alanine carboxypeptidase/D-alanyl-D-alanine-endopeptidase [Corynebacterium sp. TAE3-ERU12]